MKVTRRQLNEIIDNCLKDDSLNEGEFGKIDRGVEFQFCDLSGIPEIFNGFFDAIRQKDLIAIDREITKQMGKSVDRAEIARLEAKRESIGTDSGFFESILNNSLMKTLISALGPGLSFLTLTNKAECDRIVAHTRNFVYNVLAPTFGLSPERLKAEDAKNAEIRRSRQPRRGSGASASIAAVGGIAVFEVISNAFDDNRIVSQRNRNKIQNKVIDSKLTNFHFDLLELLAPEEYIEFVNDPSEDIKGTAIDRFKSAAIELERNGNSSFARWANAFTNSTPGTRDDSDVKQILRSAKLADHFDNPGEATEYVRECLNELINELDFEGFNILTKI
jgi:hypothetical protein